MHTSNGRPGVFDSDFIVEDLTAPEGAPDADANRVPTLRERLDAGLLEDALNPDRPLLRLEDAGLGKWIDRTLGGGLQPGNMVGLVSSGAGVGKTALAHQLADGFAKHSARQLEDAAGSGRRPTVTPVLFVTEMQVRDLTLRTLARESGVPGNLLRAPSSWIGKQYSPDMQDKVTAAIHTNGQSNPPQRATDGEFALWAARHAAERFRPAAELITPVDRTQRITGVQWLTNTVQAIRERWEREADVAAVILVVDPVHRLLDASMEETAAIGDTLGELLHLTQSERCITLFTSDTTKEALRAAGEGKSTPEQQAELAFRGSYQLVHLPDFIFGLRVLDPEKQNQADQIGEQGAGYFERGHGAPYWATVYADIVSPKTRWGKTGSKPAYWYDRALFRFEPIKPSKGDS